MVYKLVGGLLLAIGVVGIFSYFDIWQQVFGLSDVNDVFAYVGVAAIASGTILWSLEPSEVASRR